VKGSLAWVRSTPQFHLINILQLINLESRQEEILEESISKISDLEKGVVKGILNLSNCIFIDSLLFK